jgi:hypothetical protein
MSILTAANPIHDWITQHGRAFPTVRWDHSFRGDKQACFKNCLELAIPNFDLRYAEGYAQDASIKSKLKFHHAWLVNDAGEVIDPTWPEGQHTYFGAVFGSQYIRRRLLAMMPRRRVGSLLDAWDTDRDTGLLDGTERDWMR